MTRQIAENIIHGIYNELQVNSPNFPYFNSDSTKDCIMVRYGLFNLKIYNNRIEIKSPRANQLLTALHGSICTTYSSSIDKDERFNDSLVMEVLSLRTCRILHNIKKMYEYRNNV